MPLSPLLVLALLVVPLARLLVLALLVVPLARLLVLALLVVPLALHLAGPVGGAPHPPTGPGPTGPVVLA